MRITLHAVAVEDRAVFQRAVLRTLRAARLNDRRFLRTGLTSADADASVTDLLTYLSEPRSNAELDAFFAERFPDLPETGIWWALRSYAPLIHAPGPSTWTYGHRPSYLAAPVTAPDPAGVEESRGAPMAALARRYLAAYGPANPADLAQFATLYRPPAKQAFADLADELVTYPGPDGKPLADLATAELADTDLPVPPRLLGMWDNALLAHTDRSRLIPPDYRATVIRRNGDVLPTLLVDGYVAGVWRPVEGGIEATAFRRLPAGGLGRAGRRGARPDGDAGGPGAAGLRPLRALVDHDRGRAGEGAVTRGRDDGVRARADPEGLAARHDPALRWQVERDLAGAPPGVWEATSARVATEGFGARLLAHQDPTANGPAAPTSPPGSTSRARRPHGAGSRGRRRPGRLTRCANGVSTPRAPAPPRSSPRTAVGVRRPALLGRRGRLLHQRLHPGERSLARRRRHAAGALVPRARLADGGWNCEWVEGSTRSSFHSTLNTMKGMLPYEIFSVGTTAPRGVPDPPRSICSNVGRCTRCRPAPGRDHGPTQFAIPFRWYYSVLNAPTTSGRRRSRRHAPDRPPRPRRWRWSAGAPGRRDLAAGAPGPGPVSSEVDVPGGEPSPWLTFHALRVLRWWDGG